MLEIVMTKLLAHFPFFMCGSVSGGKMNYTRIIEAVMIAALTAFATGYVTTKLLEQKMISVETRMDKFESKFDKLISDFYEPRRR